MAPGRRGNDAGDAGERDGMPGMAARPARDGCAATGDGKTAVREALAEGMLRSTTEVLQIFSNERSPSSPSELSGRAARAWTAVAGGETLVKK